MVLYGEVMVPLRGGAHLEKVITGAGHKGYTDQPNSCSVPVLSSEQIQMWCDHPLTAQCSSSPRWTVLPELTFSVSTFSIKMILMDFFFRTTDSN